MTLRDKIAEILEREQPKLGECYACADRILAVVEASGEYRKRPPWTDEENQRGYRMEGGTKVYRDYAAYIED